MSMGGESSPGMGWQEEHLHLQAGVSNKDTVAR